LGRSAGMLSQLEWRTSKAIPVLVVSKSRVTFLRTIVKRRIDFHLSPGASRSSLAYQRAECCSRLSPGRIQAYYGNASTSVSSNRSAIESQWRCREPQRAESKRKIIVRDLRSASCPAVGLAFLVLPETAAWAPFPSLASPGARYTGASLWIQTRPRSRQVSIRLQCCAIRCGPGILPLLSLNRSVVARLNLRTRLPLAVYLTSGHFPPNR